MSRRTVLVVDDDPVFREAIGAVLETRYDVREAATGAEALAAVAEALPDIIVLDVMMDYPSEGFDVARTLRQDERTRSVPVVMLTGVDQVYNFRMETDETWVPCARFLEKPITPERLLKEIGELVG